MSEFQGYLGCPGTFTDYNSGEVLPIQKLIDQVTDNNEAFTKCFLVETLLEANVKLNSCPEIKGVYRCDGRHIYGNINNKLYII